MHQGNQKSVWVGIIIDRDLNPSITIAPEISVLCSPPPGDFYATWILVQKLKNVIDGALWKVFG
jgi:hypothetical protein